MRDAIHSDDLTNLDLLGTSQEIAMELSDILEDGPAVAALIAAAVTFISVCKQQDVEAGEVLEQMMEVIERGTLGSRSTVTVTHK